MRKLLNFILQLFLPYRCILCLETSNQRRDLCSECQKTLPILSHTCQQCGIVLPINIEKCGQCIQYSPYFDNTHVGFDYSAPVDHWLKQFKFHKKNLYARILCEIFAEQLAQKISQFPNIKPQLLLPVPLHWKRLTKRGFNQAYIIAHYLSRRLNIPIMQHPIIKRIKSTPPQSSLRQDKRRQNIKNAFTLKKPVALEHIAIIDDVMTTGNTVNELTKLLKNYGITRISVWVLTRAT